jgi:hypothetical protein
MSEPIDAQHAYEAIHAALAADPATQEPMNALVVWTELGKALNGTLEKMGADAGILRATIGRWFERRAAAPADLSRWAYKLPADARLGPDALADALKRVQGALEQKLPALSATATQAEGRKNLFLTVVRGWFPVGLDVFRAMPAARGAPAETVEAALWSWCDRYLPTDPSGPADLGVRVERS